MEDNVKGNETTSRKPDEHGCPYDDWREERRRWREKRHAWREEMRENKYRWPFHGMFVGLCLLLLGVLLLLNVTGAITGDTWWQSLLIGLGVIWIINGIVRYNHPVFHWGAYGKVVCGVILVLIGALLMAGFSQWWPVVLIVAGVAFLTRFLWHRQIVSS